MFKYQDGSEIKLGDFMRLENGTVGDVYQIIITADEMQAARVEEPGVMLDAIVDGLLYLPSGALAEDPPILVSRAA